LVRNGGIKKSVHPSYARGNQPKHKKKKTKKKTGNVEGRVVSTITCKKGLKKSLGTMGFRTKGERSDADEKKRGAIGNLKKCRKGRTLGNGDVKIGRNKELPSRGLVPDRMGAREREKRKKFKWETAPGGGFLTYSKIHLPGGKKGPG